MTTLLLTLLSPEPVQDSGNSILLEDGTSILMEDSGNLLLES